MLKMFFAGPIPGVLTMIGSGSWDAISNALTAKILLMLGASYALGTLLIENWKLKESQKPRLVLVFKPEHGDPYVVEKHTNGALSGIVRVYRVGVLNLGKEPVGNVAVLLRDFSPTEKNVKKKHEMVLMKPAGDNDQLETRADINPSDQPLKFFQVASQYFRADRTYAREPEFQQALGYSTTLRGDHEMYKLALEIDGDAAGPPMGFVYERGRDGVYELKENPFSRL